jgi:hypothetical protein
MYSDKFLAPKCDRDSEPCGKVGENSSAQLHLNVKSEVLLLLLFLPGWRFIAHLPHSRKITSHESKL